MNFLNNFHENDYVLGVSSLGAWEIYIRDLDKLRGNKRVWVLFSHSWTEEQFFLSYLDSIGGRVDSFKKRGAAVYLYDLGESIKDLGER